MITIYIDPGAGSMVIQALLATILAIPFFFRSHVSRAIQRFRRSPRSDEDSTPRD
jgi:hypothetical protein